MNVEEFRKLLLAETGWADSGWPDESDHNWESVDYALNKNAVTDRISVIDRNEHEEGNYHTDLFIVFEVENSDGTTQYFKKTGYYQSHEGAYWDGPLVEVSPATKTVTTWNDYDELDSYDSYS